MDLSFQHLPVYVSALSRSPFASPTKVRASDLCKFYFEQNGFQNPILIDNASDTGYYCDSSVDWDTLLSFVGGTWFFLASSLQLCSLISV